MARHGSFPAPTRRSGASNARSPGRVPGPLPGQSSKQGQGARDCSPSAKHDPAVPPRSRGLPQVPTLRVIHRSSVLAGREVLVHDPVVKFGRDPTCQVLFDEAADRMVSRNHAEIRWDETGPVLFPTAGKLVIMRGNPVTGPLPLKPGDIIELAGPGGPSVEIVFDLPGSVPAAPHDHEEAAQKTVLEMMPAGLMAELSSASRPTGQNIVAPNPARIPASSRQAPAPPRPPAVPAPAPPPAEESVVGTAFLAPIDAAAMLSQDEEVVQVQQKVRSRADLIRAAVIGAFVLIAAGSLAAFFIVRARHERTRAAVERVEAMLAQQQASGIVADISDEDSEDFRGGSRREPDCTAEGQHRRDGQAAPQGCVRSGDR